MLPAANDQVKVRYEADSPAPVPSNNVPVDPNRIYNYVPDVPFRVTSFNSHRGFGIKMSTRHLTAWDDKIVTIAKNQWNAFLSHPELKKLIFASQKALPDKYDYVYLRTSGKYKYCGYDIAENKNYPIESILVLPGGKLQICWPVTAKVEGKKDEKNAGLKTCKRRISTLEKELTETNAKRSKDLDVIQELKEDKKVLGTDNMWMKKELRLLAHTRGKNPPHEVKQGFVQYWVDQIHEEAGPAPPSRDPTPAPVEEDATVSEVVEVITVSSDDEGVNANNNANEEGDNVVDH